MSPASPDSGFPGAKPQRTAPESDKFPDPQPQRTAPESHKFPDPQGQQSQEQAAPERVPQQEDTSEPPQQTAETLTDTDNRGYRRPWTQPEEPTPEKVSLGEAVFSRNHRHGDPAVKRLLRSAARVVVTDSFPNAYAKAIDTCQQPVTTGRRIGIISPVGGAGKSTLAAAMALLLAHSRIDHIAAVDLAGRPSGLTQRLPAETSPPGVRELSQVAARRSAITLDDLRSNSAQLGETLHRVNLSDDDAALDPASVSGVYQVLSHTAAVSLIELPELSPELGVGPIRSLHSLIVTVPPSPAAAENTASLLKALKKHAPELPVLAVLTDTYRSRSADRRLTLRTLNKYMEEAGYQGRIYELGADRHLATGMQIRLKRMGERRRLQIAELTAEALHVAADGPQSVLKGDE